MRSNMYALSVKQWNPFVGCEHLCLYCKPSFQAQLKRWAKSHCRLCYEYKPHFHKERLTQDLPKTGYMQFIFCCSNGDIACCPDEQIEQIISAIRNFHPDKTFLIQSKDPRVFLRFKFPKNVILGTTIETNRASLTKEISKAPDPYMRYFAMKTLDHPLKMVTIEPIMRFDLDVMVNWITEINPCMVWMGYDSKDTGLLEPSLEYFQRLHWELARRGFLVLLKRVRER